MNLSLLPRLLLAFGLAAPTALASSSAYAAGRVRSKDVCPVDAHGRRLCDLKLITDETGQIKSSGLPGGYGPSDLQSAYGLPASGGAGKIVAIWGAQADYPNAESDLSVYRSTFGLPPCTSASGCFTKIDASGGTNYPPPGQDSWIFETAVDLQAVSAACPLCHIVLVEGGDLGTALATVISEGASAFSCSWTYGGNNASCQSSGFDADTAPLASAGILVAAATGDIGYDSGDTYPAECTGVLAVGGTSLTTANDARGWTESAWSFGSSQCSASVPKPSWQRDTGCATRMLADVSAAADGPAGLAVYFTQSAPAGDTFPSGWVGAEGTSFATPFVAAAFTALGIANGQFSPAWVWSNAAAFYDVTTGNDIPTSGSFVGACDSVPSSFCTAGPGYDGPTGWGTPNGGALASAVPPGLTGGDAGTDGGDADGGGMGDGGSDAAGASAGGDAGCGSGAMDATTLPRPPVDAAASFVAEGSPGEAAAGGSSTGCGCAAAGAQRSPGIAAIVAALVLGCARWRRRAAWSVPPSDA